MLSDAEPLQSSIEPGRPGDDIELFVGEARLDGEPLGAVRVWVSMRRGLKIRWKAAAPRRQIVRLDRSTLTFEHPSLGTIDLPVDINHSDGWGTSPGSDLGTLADISRVTCHWVNLPLILPADGLQSGGATWSGRWEAEASGWSMTIDSRRDHAEVTKQANELDEQFVVTHVGELRKADGSTFDADRASDVLFGWQLALSFALGRWVAPAVPIGFDREGHEVWQQWAPWRCDNLRGYESWWDTHTGDDLRSFVSSFLDAFLNADRHDEIRLAAMHVIVANHAGTTAEGKVMLAQAGLEYLSWIRLVLSGRMTRKEYKSLDTADRLRTLLSEASVSAAVPEDLPGLFDLATERHLDGPGAAIWVRNRLVHPKDPGEPYRIEGLVWQTAQLLLEYSELLLLHDLGYTGLFMRRYPPGRWAHGSEPVPWSLA